MSDHAKRNRETIAETMTALSHPRRVAIFEALRSAPDGLSFEDLLAKTDLSVSTLTHHLRPMKTAGLVASRRQRKRVALRIDGRRMTSVFEGVSEDIACAKNAPRPLRPV